MVSHISFLVLRPLLQLSVPSGTMTKLNSLCLNLDGPMVFGVSILSLIITQNVKHLSNLKYKANEFSSQATKPFREIMTFLTLNHLMNKTDRNSSKICSLFILTLILFLKLIFNSFFNWLQFIIFDFDNGVASEKEIC